MNNLPRFFFYLTGIVTISAAFIIFTSGDILTKVNDGTTTGTILFFAYGLVYMNIVALSSKRFMRRLNGPSPAAYIFGISVFAPPAVWLNIYDGDLATQPFILVILIGIACAAGAYFGHRMGLKAQIKFQQDLADYLARQQRIYDDKTTKKN